MLCETLKIWEEHYAYTVTYSKIDFVYIYGTVVSLKK